MAGAESARSFEYTPAWVVAVGCFLIVLVSVCTERGLHKLGKCFKRKSQQPLFEALQRLKEELMLLGFISLLLSEFQGMISKFCIPDHLANIMLPCKLEHAQHQPATNETRLLAAEVSQLCLGGKVPFLSMEALHELHIFIFVLAVVYVICCASTMVLGGVKMSEWRRWEHSITKEASRIHRAHAHLIHLQEFMERAGNYWRKFHVVSWMVAFFKQFYGSVTKSDYTALRSGFIREHCSDNPDYDFHKYILRTLEDDFRKIVGISWYLWLFVVIFLLMNIEGWHTYFWMTFLPLVLLLIVGAKLEHIITLLAKDVAERAEAAEGTHVMPTDELFWFNQPELVLYMIHFILFQNSFEIAFFFWIWSTHGFKSCIMGGLHFVIPRLVIAVIVQVICSYSTLPLYALVSQMGSMFKQTVFNEFTREGLQIWARNGRSQSVHGTMGTPASDPTVPSAQGSTSAPTSDLTVSHRLQ